VCVVLFAALQSLLRSVEEKERRINFLKEELDSHESQRKQERDGYRLKLEHVIQERDQEIERMKERHEDMMTRVRQDHEKELQWSHRKWQEEVEQVKSLSQAHGSIQDLVIKWKASAEEMQQLQNIVTSNQERMMNESVVELEQRGKTLSSLLQKLEPFTSLRSQLSDLVEEQKDLIVRERAELRQERNDWLRDQRKSQADQEEERHEIRMQRDSLNQEISKLHEQKLQVQRDQESITREVQEIERQRLQVQQQLSQLSDLEARSHNIATSEILLNQDKSQLLDLAQQVMRRAEELEALTMTAARERDSGIAARARAESLLKDVEKRSESVQEKLDTVQEKERLLKDQIRFLESERQAVKEMKDRIVCTLCNSSLQSYGRIPHPPPTMSMDETPLLIWQMTGQRESALLAQEAQFLDQLRAGHKGSID
jgi:Fas-binding factor 1